MVHSCVFSGWLLECMSLCAGEWLLHHIYLMADDYPCDLQQVLLHQRNFEQAPFRLSFYLIPSVLRNIDLHTITFLQSFKGSKYSLDDSRPPSFCWLVLFFTSTWLMYAANHWRRSVKESFQNRLFIKALSSLEKFIIHLLLHDSLHGCKTGYFLAFHSNFSTCVLACFFFGPFSNILVDSRKGKLLGGVPMELSLDTSAGP